MFVLFFSFDKVLLQDLYFILKFFNFIHFFFIVEDKSFESFFFHSYFFIGSCSDPCYFLFRLN